MAFRTSRDAVNINRLSDGLYLEGNQGFTAVTGFTAQDVEGRTSQEIRIWNDLADRTRLVEGLRSEGTVNNLEAEFLRKDGSVTTALMSAQVVELDGEKCILSVTRDISDRKAAEDALHESEEWHRTVLETAIDGFWLVDMEGKVIEVNEAYCRMSGYSEAELIGMHISDVEAAQKPEEIAETIRILAERGYARFESMHRRKDGTVFDVEVNVQFRADRGGLMVAFVQDITERKRAEGEILRLNTELEERVQERTEELTATNEELIEANLQLETATRAKSEFLASMSHELRTPLNSVIGFSDILSRGMAGELEPEQKRQTEMINASGRHLLVLVNEVLDLSAIEAGRMKLERAPVEVTVLVTQVTGVLMPLALHSGLDLTWTVSPDATFLESDHTRLEQVLYNLIGNAIKFTDQGTVHLDARRRVDDIEFVITDTGRGISPEELTHVFDEFYQVKRRDLGKSEGTGLGLTVSRRLVEMLGGSIAVESELGVGSTFTVRIPIGGTGA
jgi:PAS domain S-box-containing protein